MNIVLDTNIYLAAMGEKSSLCKPLFLHLAGNGAYQLCISPDILKELHNKAVDLITKKLLAYKSFKKLTNLIFRKTYLIIPTEHLDVVKRDPADNKILECALACKAHLIITMDQDLIKLKQYHKTGIVHPQTLRYMFGEVF